MTGAAAATDMKEAPVSTTTAASFSIRIAIPPSSEQSDNSDYFHREVAATRNETDQCLPGAEVRGVTALGAVSELGAMSERQDENIS